MPVTTLVPVSTTSHVQMPPFPSGTAAAVLSDSDDGTYVTAQFSEFESSKAVWGVGPGAMTQLPVGAGKVNSATFKVRGNRTANPASGNIHFGEYPNSRVSGATTTTITTFTGAPVVGVWTHAAQINALGWIAQAVWVSQNGMSMFIMRGEVDVDWNPKVQGGRGMFLGLLIASALGRLAAVGLEEMPALAREVRRLSPTLILPGEYRQAWRELREDPRRLYFVL